MTKNILLAGRKYSIEGVSNDDFYFKTIVDGSEQGFANFVANYLPSDAVALDVGANIGITSLILSDALKNGVIHAFEPSFSVFRVLQNNISTNSLQNIKMHRMALGNSEGKVKFISDSAYGHITEDTNVGEEVDCSTVDAQIKRLDLKRLDFIKIDVEGNERAVLEGAKQTINHFNPLILMEFNSWCLTAYGNTNTVKFARELVDIFGTIRVLDAITGAVGEATSDFLAVAHRNMVHDGCVSNLILTTDVTRLKPPAKN